MSRILVIVLVAGVLGIALGNIQVRMKPQVEERFYLAVDKAVENPAGQSQVQPSAVEPETKTTQTPSPVSESLGVPVVEFPEGTVYKFETMKHGTTLSHDFPLRNTGTAPLKLLKAGSTCKCTVGELDKDIIMPGETTMIHLEWRGVSVTSSFGQSATFKSNSVDMPEIKLEIKGAVIDSFVLEPDQINLGSFASDVGTTREFSVFGYAEGVDLDRLEWSNPETSKFIKLTSAPFSPTESTGHTKALKAHKVTLEVLPGMPVGPTSGKVLLLTDQGDEVDKLELQVNGTVVSEISVIGGSMFKSDTNILSIGNVASADGFSTKIWLVLRGEGHESMEVKLDQKDAKDSLNVSLGERKVEANRTVIPINFDVPKGAPEAYYPGSGKGTYAEVVVRTNSIKAFELPLHIRLVITK